MENRLRKLAVSVIGLLLIVAGCAPGAAPAPTLAQPAQPPGTAPTATTAPQPKVADPETVLRAITDALNRKDAEAATALVADDVVQTLIPAPNGTGIYQGKEAMHARFKEAVATNPVNKLANCQTTGDEVVCDATYADDSTRPLGFDLEFTVEAVVQNGLLKTVTWKMADASLAKMQAAIAPKPTSTFEPEELAGKTADIVGVWNVAFLYGAGLGHLEFKPDGSYSIEGVEGDAKGATVDIGTFWFDGTQLKLKSAHDCLTAKKDAVACLPIYQVYLTKQDGLVIRIKMVAVDDPGVDRKATLTNQVLRRAAP